MCKPSTNLNQQELQASYGERIDDVKTLVFKCMVK